ncbi:MAG: hypothetical protein KGP35_00975 [Bacteroidetes bacterium]|nr:hypothetical protein [Bacteroidota bacterium]
MQEPTFTLLITACISPDPSAFKFNANFRIDPQVRMQDYLKCFHYWLNYEEPKIRNIVFVENSGCNIDSIKEMAAVQNRFHRNIEFIQLRASPLPTGLHYGYAELEMIDEAVEKSKLIHQTSYFIKVTGRLYFPKLSKLIGTMHGSIRFLSDSRDYAFAGKEKRYIVTTLLMIQTDFYREKLWKARNEMMPGIYSHFETLYYQLLKPLSSKDKSILLRFPFNVDPVGYGAHWNVNYNSFPKKIESALRAIARVILPSFRI